MPRDEVVGKLLKLWLLRRMNPPCLKRSPAFQVTQKTGDLRGAPGTLASVHEGV